MEMWEVDNSLWCTDFYDLCETIVQEPNMIWNSIGRTLLWAEMTEEEKRSMTDLMLALLEWDEFDSNQLVNTSMKWEQMKLDRDGLSTIFETIFQEKREQFVEKSSNIDHTSQDDESNITKDPLRVQRFTKRLTANDYQELILFFNYLFNWGKVENYNFNIRIDSIEEKQRFSDSYKYHREKMKVKNSVYKEQFNLCDRMITEGIISCDEHWNIVFPWWYFLSSYELEQEYINYYFSILQNGIWITNSNEEFYDWNVRNQTTVDGWLFQRVYDHKDWHMCYKWSHVLSETEIRKYIFPILPWKTDVEKYACLEYIAPHLRWYKAIQCEEWEDFQIIHLLGPNSHVNKNLWRNNQIWVLLGGLKNSDI